MTVINPNSISGITSITLPAGADNVLTIHTNDGVERFRIDSSGNIKVGTAATISPDGDLFVTGVCTATTLSGAASGLTGALPAIDGSALTGIAATDNVRTGILDVAGIATFRNDVNIGAAVTISESGIEASGIGITVASINGGQVSGRKNKIINGAMRIAQRGTSFASASNEYTLDRFRIQNSHDGAVTITQSTTSPDGFSNSLKVDVTTADTSIASSQYLQLAHRLEAQDLQDLAYGTSAAKSITVSFYVRSNLTGTYTFNIQQADNSSKQVSQTFTIDSADTWERKTFTFAGDTSGIINNDNTQGLVMYWNLSIGDTYTTGTSRAAWTTFANADFAAGHTANLLSSTSNEFYLTGVQLEVGSQATDFEHLSAGEEERLCQRYYFRFTASTSGTHIAMGHQMTSSAAKIILPFPNSMRTRPTAVETTGTATDYSVARTSTYEVCDAVPTFAGASKEVANVNTSQVQASLSTGIAVVLRANTTSFYLGFSAEL